MLLTDKTGKEFRSGHTHVSVDPKDKMNVYISLHEGKNRVVRRIFETLGYTIRQLVRIQIGNIKIHGLERGKWRKLTEEEREELVKEKRREEKIR